MSDCVTFQQATTLIEGIRDGHQPARAELCRLVYAELRQIAHRLMPRAAGHTLQPTALVNEVMVRLLDQETLTSFPDRRCLFNVAIQAMKQVLMDHHRGRKSLKRGGDWHRQPLDAVLDVIQCESQADFETLYEALEQLEQEDPRQHEVVQLRFFGGLSVEETARLLEISRSTVARDWRLARAKLYAAIRES